MKNGEGANTGIVALVVILVLVLLVFGTYAMGVWPFTRDVTINEGDTVVEDDEPDQTNVNIFPDDDGNDGDSGNANGSGDGPY